MTDHLLKGRTALVTGGGSGIGAACALAFASAGAAVIVTDRDQKAAQVIADQIMSPVSVNALDVSDAEAVKSLFETLNQNDMTPDLLVNCAGIREIINPLDLAPCDWQRVISINLSGTFFTCQAFGQNLRKKSMNGAIVNIASTTSFLAAPDRVAYVSSKHGVAGLTKQLAFDLGPLGIRVNAVAPGVIRTPLTESYFDDPEHSQRLNNACPLGRVGETDDVVDVVLFLASNAARFVTGAVVPVDGGYTAGKDR